jgi:hypothetical protein
MFTAPFSTSTSKLSDLNGNPLVLYHGTTKTFTQFNPSTTGAQGPGIYMTDGPNNYGSFCMRLHVHMANPYFFYPSEESLDADVNGELIEQVLPQELAAAVIERIASCGADAYGFEVQQALCDRGHDGIIMVYPFGEPVIPGATGAAVVIAFNSDQVEILPHSLPCKVA